MPYGLIALVASVALTATYVFTADAPAWTKVLVVVLLVLSFIWRFGLFLQAGLSISILLYMRYVKAST